jgi:hypothetical protein
LQVCPFHNLFGESDESDLEIADSDQHGGNQGMVIQAFLQRGGPGAVTQRSRSSLSPGGQEQCDAYRCPRKRCADVQRSVRELPLAARSLVEGAGHHIQRVFLMDVAEPFFRCPLA